METTAKPLLDYGVLGIMCFIFLCVIGTMFWMGWKANRSYIDELKEDRKERMEMMNQLIHNNNRVIENNNEMIKGFIDIVASFKALLNVVIDQRGSRKGL